MKTKTIKNTIAFFIICFLAIFSSATFAQKLTLQGDTIYVNEKTRVTIEFPGEIYGEPQLVDQEAPYKIVKKLNFVFITATSKDTKPVSAIISEGKRDHSIVLSYKANLKVDDEDFYDLGTPKKLDEFIKTTKERIKKRSSAMASNTSRTNQTNNAIQTAQKAAADTQKDEEKTRINAILKDGDAAFKMEDLDKAETLYKSALNIESGNFLAKKAIADIADKRELKKRSTINEYKSNGKKAFEEGNFAEAINQYKKVLDLDQKDLFASGQISEMQKKMEAAERNKKLNEERQAQIEKDTRVNNFKSTGAKALSERKYDDAISAYQAVLAINEKDEFSANKIREIQKIREKEESNSKAAADFNTYIADADKAVANNELELAKSLYASAKKIKSTDLELDKKVAAVNEKILIKENEDKYRTAMLAGDEAKKAGDYERAKTEFTKAAILFKNRTDAAVQLKEINETLAHESSLKKANAEYMSAIEKADKALANKDIATAKTYFKMAAGLKSAEEYPKNKLAEIDNIENAMRASKDYLLAMQKAKAALDRKDYVAAKKAYSEAHAFKPLEDEPPFQIQLIEKKLSEKDTNGQYDSLMAKGNLAISDKNYSLALENYKGALRIKPTESLALNQIQFVQNMITQDSLKQAEVQRRAIARVQEEVRKKRFSEGMDYFVAYDRAAQVADMEKEVYYLKKFLNVFPDESEFNDYQYSKKIADAKKKIEDIRSYWNRTKKTYQPEVDSVPYLIQDLEKKYPEINYSAIREEQKMIAIDNVSVEEAMKITKELIAEKPRLTWADSVNNLKLICQGIKFIKAKAYYKLLLQNNDTNDFLTGTMVLKHVKKGGATTNYYPDYISAFPIVLPGKEFYIIYSTKDFEVEDKDNLSFEMNDRLKKTTLNVIIPGKAYNEEKKSKPI